MEDTAEMYHDAEELQLRADPDRHEDYVDIGHYTLYAVFAIFGLVWWIG